MAWGTSCPGSLQSQAKVTQIRDLEVILKTIRLQKLNLTLLRLLKSQFIITKKQIHQGLFITNVFIDLHHTAVTKHKYYGNGAILTAQNLSLKYCQSLGQTICQQKRFTSFKRGTVSLCRSKSCEVKVHQTLRIIQLSKTQTRAASE